MFFILKQPNTGADQLLKHVFVCLFVFGNVSGNFYTGICTEVWQWNTALAHTCSDIIPEVINSPHLENSELKANINR